MARRSAETTGRCEANRRSDQARRGSRVSDFRALWLPVRALWPVGFPRFVAADFRAPQVSKSAPLPLSKPALRQARQQLCVCSSVFVPRQAFLVGFVCLGSVVAGLAMRARALVEPSGRHFESAPKWYYHFPKACSDTGLLRDATLNSPACSTILRQRAGAESRRARREQSTRQSRRKRHRTNPAVQTSALVSRLALPGSIQSDRV